MWGMFLCVTRGLQRMIIIMSNPDILSKTGRDIRLLKYKSDKIKLVTPVEFVSETEGKE